jgi:hypothetical protein
VTPGRAPAQSNLGQAVSIPVAPLERPQFIEGVTCDFWPIFLGQNAPGGRTLVNVVNPVKRLCAAIAASATSKSLVTGTMASIVEKMRRKPNDLIEARKAQGSEPFQSTFGFAPTRDRGTSRAPAPTAFSERLALRR